MEANSKNSEGKPTVDRFFFDPDNFWVDSETKELVSAVDGTRKPSPWIVYMKNPINGDDVPLRSTVIAFHMDRATLWIDEFAARAGLEHAKQFMKAKTFKAMKVIRATEYVG